MSQFDRFATDYEHALARNLRFVPGGVDYYYANRAFITKRVSQQSEPVNRILDFGAGVGLAGPHLRRQFPHAQLHICDTSRDSIEIASQRNPDAVVVSSDELEEDGFNIIFVAGVIHHVDDGSRPILLRNLEAALRPGGTLVVFELNPINPVTRRLVRTCPFDEDAALISKSDLIVTLKQNTSLSISHQGFTVFLPPIFKFFSPIERLLTWFPVGAQYYVAATKLSS